MGLVGCADGACKAVDYPQIIVMAEILFVPVGLRGSLSLRLSLPLPRRSFSLMYIHVGPVVLNSYRKAWMVVTVVCIAGLSRSSRSTVVYVIYVIYVNYVIYMIYVMYAI